MIVMIVGVKQKNLKINGGTFMTYYQKRKAKLIEQAIEWQSNFADSNYSYEECICYGNYFKKLGRRYGLLREFRENGIC